MKLVKESLDPDFDRFMNEKVDEVNKISSISEMKDYVFKMTNGHHFPLNPIDPLRSTLREKLTELSETDISEADEAYLSNLSYTLRDDWHPIDLPPGAMH